MIHEDITRAHTLPSEYYRDPEIFYRLRERVLGRAWQWVEGSELSIEPASVRPFTLLRGCLEEPLLLSRDEQGVLRCLSNVCTHRGNLVCVRPEKAVALRCGYHGRRFALNGKFSSMPEFEDVKDFPSPADDLPEVPLRKLGPLIFTAIDPVVDFDEWVAPVLERMDFLPWERLTLEPQGSRDYEVRAHWLAYCDNFLEGFHIPYVHPSLNRLIDFASYRTELFPWGSVQVAQAANDKDAFPGTRVAGHFFFLFPNTLLNFYPWGLSLNVVVPLAPERTRIMFRSFVLDSSRKGQGAGGDLDTVEQEDEAVVEQVQRGMAARLYRRGRYSPSHELGLHHFHRLLLRALE